MQTYLQFALVTFTSVLFIVDPIAVVPTYLVITQGQTAEHRRATASGTDAGARAGRAGDTRGTD